MRCWKILIKPVVRAFRDLYWKFFSQGLNKLACEYLGLVYNLYLIGFLKQLQGVEH